MEKHSCEEALDCLFAIYKVSRYTLASPRTLTSIYQVSQKTFVANVTTQVVERHIVKGLETIFSPVVVNAMSDAEVEEIAMEPVSAKRQRDFLEDRIKKLNIGATFFALSEVQHRVRCCSDVPHCESKCVCRF